MLNLERHMQFYFCAISWLLSERDREYIHWLSILSLQITAMIYQDKIVQEQHRLGGRNNNVFVLVRLAIDTIGEIWSFLPADNFSMREWFVFRLLTWMVLCMTSCFQHFWWLSNGHRVENCTLKFSVRLHGWFFQIFHVKSNYSVYFAMHCRTQNSRVLLLGRLVNFEAMRITSINS